MWDIFVRPTLLTAATVLIAWLAGWAPGTRAAEAADVVIEAISRPCMAGAFRRGATGLRFQTCKDGPIGSVQVGTLDGQELVYIRPESGDLVISVHSRALTLRVPGHELEQASALASPFLAFGRLGRATEVRGDTAAIAELGRTPAYALLPELSYQLGKLGISGRAYPPSLLLHALALAAAEQLGIEPARPDVVYRIELPPELSEAGVGLLRTLWPDACDSRQLSVPGVEPPASCPEACDAFPNRDEDCFGMCGPGCDRCWHWVCGDCCYHAFCAAHDEVMRACQNSANPLACVNVLPWYFILGGCDELPFRQLPH